MTYEYKVVPSPTRGQKGKGIKGPEGRFANALELHMNYLAGEGWEFVRAETLPHEERSGLTSTSTTYRTVLVYRRPALTEPLDETETPEPAALPSPEQSEDSADQAVDAQEDTVSEAPETDAEEPAERDQDEVVRAGVQSLKQE
ncbi:DUF4177 domain-containing protein [Shimia sp. R9_2]|uniref:DUF4177 domain-containing protein n=1 Tax=Shimia sp. R9_2 TaxID=2821112 RepID=UPI001AD99F14|nr:DUF4177 domain-containing protein [Shimia sp. R9_2]MBO9397489.1 DUF4177 domain-containing protein [Shimia sp. R9_2]